MPYLMVFFGILTVVFGLWGFDAWGYGTWATAQVPFWFCLAVFILLTGYSLLALVRRRRGRLPR